jgi:hypothetical protein
VDSLPTANAETTRFFHHWLETFSGYVRDVDYASARPLFHPDVLAFGTHNDVIPGVEQMDQDAVGQRLAEDERLPLHAGAEPGAGLARRKDGDRDRAVDQHGVSTRRQTVSAARPRHHGVFKVCPRKSPRLAVHAFPHVAQSRCAADEPRQSAGEGMVR